jgi:hypothetical protein
MTRKNRITAALATAAVAVAAFAGSANAANAKSTVSIMGTNGDYYGYVESKKPECENDRKVVVYKQLGSTQSPKTDQKIGSDTADNGEWSIGNSGYKTGKFYAKAAKVPGFCKVAFSPTITR